jgi:hypothetical protein
VVVSSSVFALGRSRPTTGTTYQWVVGLWTGVVGLDGTGNVRVRFSPSVCMGRVGGGRVVVLVGPLKSGSATVPNFGRVGLRLPGVFCLCSVQVRA